MRGVFRQSPEQPHVEFRRALLGSTGRLPLPPGGADAAADDPPGLNALVEEQIRNHGAALVRLDRPLTTPEFLAFGRPFGTPQPERAPAVQPFVDSQVVLNLVTSSPPTEDVDLQPFGGNWLSLHSESSAASVAAQPRYVVLMCITPGIDPRCAETVLVPMAEVHRRLSATDRAILVALRYDRGDPPTILRTERGRPVLSIRDFQEDPLHWVLADGAPATDPSEVDAALTRLYAAMYSSGGYAVRWERGLLVVLDNQVHLHGRTAGVAAAPGATRHLKRLRLAARSAVGAGSVG